MKQLLNVLVIEDDLAYARLLETYLEDSVVFDHVDTLGKAFEKLEGGNYQVILTDLHLPDSQGFETFTRLHAKVPEIPIVILSSLDDENMSVEAVRRGAQDYLMKGHIDEKLLPRVIRYAIERRNMQRELEVYRIQLEAANRRLQELANRDGLTGIYNRRYFDKRAAQECGRAMRVKEVFSVIILDIDHFKRFNDTYGHQSGDECLQRVAEVLRDSANRSVDIVARYGGEEFIVLLPNTASEGAVALAETMRQQVSALEIKHESQEHSAVVTASFGVSSMVPTRMTDVAKLINAADKALYEAKAGGRNRVLFSKEP